jgi:hypothetical protein
MPKNRRDYKTGSVYQRHTKACPPLEPGPPHPETGEPTKVRPKHKCNGLWIGAISVDGWTETGSRRRIPLAAKTEAGVRKKLRDKLLQIERDGVPSASASARTTVKDWAEQWLDITTHKLRPKSYATDASAVRKWIIPTIGHKRLAQLTPGDRRAVANKQRDAGRKSSTALRTDTTLVSMLQAAMIEGHHIPANVFLVARPTINANDRQAMETDEAIAVLGVAAGLPHASRWVAALLEALRQGEALGLTWPCVKPGGLPVMDISWQLQSLPYIDRRNKALGFRVPDGYESRHLEGALHLTRPKTSAGQRIIPLVPWMDSALEAWREVAPHSPHGLVWPATDGRPADAKQDLEEWYALQDAAGHIHHPSGRFYYGHETRHTTISLLKELGVDDAVIAQIVGQSKLVESYVHLPQRMTLAALNKLADRLQLSPPATS